ncbi:iron chelate uptake ABC transporter family permease subunit [Bacillus sp. 37MA]|uniref:iron chelate uptake ABC transporter family permease subunit n=1 Tax=Bacillus sp. 37MA TaxID=1132442 RepID=UPI0009E36ECE
MVNCARDYSKFKKNCAPSTSLLFITTAGIGAILVVLADWIARIAFQPLDIPAGVFTSGIGTPFFLYLLIKN